MFLIPLLFMQNMEINSFLSPSFLNNTTRMHLRNIFLNSFFNKISETDNFFDSNTSIDIDISSSKTLRGFLLKLLSCGVILWGSP